MNFILPFCQKYWKQIAFCAFIAIIFVIGYYKGYSHEKMRYDAFVKEIERQSMLNQIENDRKLLESHKITENVAKEYANAVDKLKSYYANVKWVQPSSCHSKVSELSSTTSGANESASDIEIGTEGITPLDCASTTLQLLELQSWVKQQSEIK